MTNPQVDFASPGAQCAPRGQPLLGLMVGVSHLWGDYVFQSDRMAAHKLTCRRTRAAHVTLYTLPFVLFSLAYGRGWRARLWFVCLVWLTHFLTDSFRVSLGSQWPLKALFVDQTIHLTTLAFLTKVLTQGE